MWELIITGMVLLVIALITIDRNKKKKAREDDKLRAIAQSSTEVSESKAPVVTKSPLWISMRDEQLRNYRSSVSTAGNTVRPTRGNPKPSSRRPSPPSATTRSSSKSRSSSGSSGVDTSSDYTPSYSSTSSYGSGSSSSHHSSHQPDTSSHSDFSGGGGDSGGGGSSDSWSD